MLTPFARPLAAIVATLVLEEDQVTGFETEFVRFCVLPSLYVPVAVNCWVSPAEKEGFAGVTATDFSAGTVTAIVAAPDFVASITEVEVSVTLAGLGTLEGAV